MDYSVLEELMCYELLSILGFTNAFKTTWF